MCRREGPGTIEKCCGGVSPLWAGVEGRGTSLRKSPPQVMPTQGLHLITTNKVGVIIKQAAEPEWRQWSEAQWDLWWWLTVHRESRSKEQGQIGCYLIYRPQSNKEQMDWRLISLTALEGKKKFWLFLQFQAWNNSQTQNLSAEGGGSCRSPSVSSELLHFLLQLLAESGHCREGAIHTMTQVRGDPDNPVTALVRVGLWKQVTVELYHMHISLSTESLEPTLGDGILNTRGWFKWTHLASGKVLIHVGFPFLSQMRVIMDGKAKSSP